MKLLVNIDVDDIGRGMAFYRDGLEMSVRRRLGDGVVELAAGSTFVYLLAGPPATPAFPGDRDGRDYRRHWTPVHIDVVVNDIDAALRRALAAGATLERPVTVHAWGSIAGLVDPFGHGICLIEFSELGYDAIADDTAKETGETADAP